ncbi:MAG TPA: hypothetical protein VIS06_17555 [Mycobacteriales bacterium]
MTAPDPTELAIDPTACVPADIDPRDVGADTDARNVAINPPG